MSGTTGVGTFAEIASFVTAFGILMGAAAGWVTYLFYHRKTLNENWGTVFRALYAEYWNSDDMAKMRKCIASEEEYSQLEIILRKRLSTAKNVMSSDENDVLEKVDKFCALMIRIISFGERDMDDQQRDLYNPLFTYWTDAVLHRAALMEYIALYWKSLNKRLKDTKRV